MSWEVIGTPAADKFAAGRAVAGEPLTDPRAFTSVPPVLLEGQGVKDETRER